MTDCIHVKPYPQQDAFIRCPDRFTAFIAGIRAGKTWAGAVKALMNAAERRGLGMIVAPTYPMSRDITARMFATLAGQAVVKFNRSEMRMELANGAEVLFRSADNPESLRGLGLTWAWIDEAALCPPETWDIVIGRLSEGEGAPCWITTTPKGRNWVYERTAQMTVFRAKIEDNPYLDAQFVAALRVAYSGKFAQQELDAEFVAFEGVVYTEFDKTLHVIDRPAGDFVQVIAGIDEGYVNPSVILVVGIDAAGRAHVLHEFYQRCILQETFVAEALRIMREYHVSRFYADPSASGLIAALNAAGVPTFVADNAVMPGIQLVKSRLAQRTLTVSPSAVNTIAEFESYSWAEGRAGLKDAPAKINDHAMDALRYALMSSEQKEYMVLL